MQIKDEYLLNALEILFKEKNNLGYWESEKNRLISKITHDQNFNWFVSNESDSDRYGVFTITCILLAKHLYKLDTKNYDEKIIKYLKYIETKIDSYDLGILTYGAYNAQIIGQIVYKEQYTISIEKNELIFTNLKKKLTKIQNNEYSLILIGLTLYYTHINKSDTVLSYINKLVNDLLKSQNKKGIFETGDLRSVYHQRTSYVLWGLAFSSSILNKNQICDAIKISLTNIWENNRFLNKNAFLWHPKIYITKNKLGLPIPILSFKSSKFLFECHQTFFCNSVNLYQLFCNDTFYKTESLKALEWIFGDNSISKNLVEFSNIGIPIRLLTTDNKTFVAKQNFKGSYEIGSYILALARFSKLNKQ